MKYVPRSDKTRYWTTQNVPNYQRRRLFNNKSACNCCVCVVWTYFNDVGRGDVGSEYRKPTPFVRKHEMCSVERTLTSKISAESNGIHYKGFRNAKIRGRELHLPGENACVSDTKSILIRIPRDVFVRANGRGSKRPFAIGSGLGTKTRDQKRAL